jgi:hypothetical protein
MSGHLNWCHRDRMSRRRVLRSHPGVRGLVSMTRSPRKPTRLAQAPAQLQFEFMHTMPPRLSPAAEAKQYAEYRRSARGEPRRRSPRQKRRPSHGHWKTA